MPSTPVPSAGALLAWYDSHRRNLPWRAACGETPDPYRVWLSEIMLQQTTVAAVIPYYERFVAQFPTVEALAAAPLDAVLAAWSGLGYYARARNLHACARAVMERGEFPGTLADLRSLPGIGVYTAAAIGAIAFGIPAIPVDGNVERVVSRMFAIREPMPQARRAIRDAAARLGEEPDARARPSDFAQGLFDLGATICTPAAPACGACPWTAVCAGRLAGLASELPRKPARRARPVRHGAHFWIEDKAGRVLLRRRPLEGLLGGMAELPGTPWRPAIWPAGEALAHAPAPAEWYRTGQVRHVFTHFELVIDLFVAHVHDIPQGEGFLVPTTSLGSVALPSLMRKCVAMAQTRQSGLSSDATKARTRSSCRS